MNELTSAQELLNRRSINQNTTTTTTITTTDAGTINGNETIAREPAILSDGRNNATSTGTILTNDTSPGRTRSGLGDTLLPNYPCDIDNVWFLEEEMPNFFGEDEPISDCVYGSTVTDYIDGDSGNDYLYGREDNDVVFGASGNDMIVGNIGADFLRGGSENDSIYGGMHTDMIQDEEGDDRVYGENGDDDVINGPGVDQLNCGAGVDVIWSLPTDSGDVVNEDCEIRTPYSPENCPPGTDPRLPGGFGACMPF
jgi:Ca2+-binding RTX toxin-like protein